MILIKLGGSVITEKKKPLTPRKNAIEKIGRAISKITEPAIIVHGGGSFGHFWSVKYDMHTKEAKCKPKGVAIVKNSMVALNNIVLDGLLKGGTAPYCAPPFGITRAGKLLPQGAKNCRNCRHDCKYMSLAYLWKIMYHSNVWQLLTDGRNRFPPHVMHHTMNQACQEFMRLFNEYRFTFKTKSSICP